MTVVKKNLNGFRYRDQTVRLFRTAPLAPRGVVQTRAKVLHYLTIVRISEVFTYFFSLFLIRVVFKTTTRIDVRPRLR